MVSARRVYCVVGDIDNSAVASSVANEKRTCRKSMNAVVSLEPSDSLIQSAASR
jgi:hypothetical protein